MNIIPRHLAPRVSAKKRIEKKRKRKEKERETKMKVRVRRVVAVEPKKEVEEKISLLMPVKITGSSLSCGLSRKLGQYRVAIVRPNGGRRWL